MNVVEEMTELAFARPQPGDPPERVARWYLAKSRLHEYLAGCGDRDAEMELRLAVSARAHADDLLGRGVREHVA
ncbi:hypothetical protein OG921_01595 [Aldersonia sp. NBC_00410]|jgi:hypothetical protein|uniref:hypothetical protein n=1 Tax=Aldersonia sp. NBC_00410 TaxID=2975954 RepID=UPI0022539057|nr:hypothetical protein [Aldersonia sp. NBC_00410]MCX5041886.1 hypothetical protein [Aldersonia sp. NBC_00410]